MPHPRFPTFIPQDYLVSCAVPLAVGGMIYGFQELYVLSKAGIAAPILFFLLIVVLIVAYFSRRFRLWCWEAFMRILCCCPCHRAGTQADPAPEPMLDIQNQGVEMSARWASDMSHPHDPVGGQAPPNPWGTFIPAPSTSDAPFASVSRQFEDSVAPPPAQVPVLAKPTPRLHVTTRAPPEPLAESALATSPVRNKSFLSLRPRPSSRRGTVGNDFAAADDTEIKEYTINPLRLAHEAAPHSPSSAGGNAPLWPGTAGREERGSPSLPRGQR